MGCCQNHLDNSSIAVNTGARNLIDKIKQNKSESNQNDEGLNKVHSQPINKEFTEYEYSVHNLQSSNNQFQNSVSIMMRKNQSLSNTKHKSYAQIHPYDNNHNHSLSHPQNYRPCSQSNLAFSSIFLKQSLSISKIQLLNEINIVQLQFPNLGSDSSQFGKHELIDNEKQKSQLQLLKQAFVRFSDRELIELHDQLTTMMVNWNQNSMTNKKLMIDQKIVLNHPTDQQQEKQLENIWSKKTLDQLEFNSKLTKLKNQFIISKKHTIISEGSNENLQQNKKNCQKPLNSHHPKLPKKQLHNSNYFKQKNYPNFTKTRNFCKGKQAKRRKNLNKCPQTQTKPLLKNSQQMLFSLSKIKSRQKQDNIFLNEQADYSESSNDHQQSCKLTNPTKILNQSFDQECQKEKNLFYFGQTNCYQKWEELNRQAHQITQQTIILLLFNQFSSNCFPIELINFFTVLLCVIYEYKKLTKINLIAYKFEPSRNSFKVNDNFNGFRIFQNGVKRTFPFLSSIEETNINFELFRFLETFYKQNINPAQLIYNLTGWIPEYIPSEEINTFKEVFQRLNHNFIQGNTIITFCGKQNQIWGLKRINVEQQLIQLYGKRNIAQQSKSIHQFEEIYSWVQFFSLIKWINVNWNPQIYDFIWKTQNFFYESRLFQKDSIGQIDKQYICNKSHQYLLRIPANQDDLEFRIFLQVHEFDQSKTQFQPLIFQLYDYFGYRVQNFSSPIRQIQKNKIIYSDVIIFEASKETTEYVFLVRPINRLSLDNEIKYTISAFAFLEVGISQIPMYRVIEQKQIVTYLHQSQCGSNMNSPYFLQNFCLQLNVPLSQRIKIFISMPQKLNEFEINLIQNRQKQQNLTRLNLENILSNIITSQEFQNGKGYLQIQTKCDQYFLIINNYTKSKGQLKIILQIIEKTQKFITQSKLTQIQQTILPKNSLKIITFKEKFFYQEPLFKKQFKWALTNTGPRKRLKSNTHSEYQPLASFKEFFKNPFLDLKLEKNKKYQFSVHSKTYFDWFDSIANENEKRNGQPPTISMSILKIKRAKKHEGEQKSLKQGLLKIILDDEFYIPFGFGFWTKPMQFEEGQYRFVFPKMEQQVGIGIFSFYEIKQ